MSGKAGSASFGVLLVDGYDLLPAKVKSFTHKIESVLEGDLGLGDSTEGMTPTGVVKLTVTQGQAFFSDATNGAHALLAPVANLQVSRLLTAAFAGNVIGRPFLGASGLYVPTYEVLSQSAQLTKANASYQVSGTLDRGVILNALAAKTADWNTKTDGAAVDYTTDTSQRVIPITSNSMANPTVVTTPVPHGLATSDIVLIAGVASSSPTINGERTVTVLTPTTFSVPVNTSAGAGGTGGSFVRSNSPNGGVGYLEVSALSGFTGFIGKIRDSADDVTYADLLTFSNVTAWPAAERVTVGGVVDRFLSFNGDVTGSGSISVFVGFARS